MSRTKKEKETEVAYMLKVMLADGKVHSEELKWFEMVCGKLGFTSEETMAFHDRVRNNPESLFDIKKFTPAKDAHERVNQLMSAVMMMMSDGDIDDIELEICRDYAGALGLEKDIVSNIIEDIKKLKTSSGNTWQSKGK